MPNSFVFRRNPVTAPGVVPPKPGTPSPTGWQRATIAPDEGQKREKSGLKIGVGGTRHPAYQLTAAQCSAMLTAVPVIDPQAPTKRMMEVEYRLEKLDPNHRFGALLLPLLRWWDTLDHNEFPNFFAFLDLIDERVANDDFRRPEFRLAAGVDEGAAEEIRQGWLEFLQTSRGVAYLTLLQRSRYQANIVGGLVHWRGAADEASPLSTTGATTGMGGTGYIWALDRWNKLFTGVSEVGKFHHSTLAMGRALRGAGEWTVELGQVRRIAGITGHYRVSIYQLYESIRIMRDVLRINLERAEVMLKRLSGNQSSGYTVHVSAAEFLANPGMRETHALKVDFEVQPNHTQPTNNGSSVTFAAYTTNAAVQRFNTGNVADAYSVRRA